MTPTEVAWTAGFMEGEGAFDHHGTSPRVEAAQVERDPLERLHRLFGGTLTTRHLNPKWQVQNYWYAYGANAVGMMLTIYAYMSPKRKQQIRGAISRWRPKNKNHNHPQFTLRMHAPHPESLTLVAHRGGTE